MSKHCKTRLRRKNASPCVGVNYSGFTRLYSHILFLILLYIYNKFSDLALTVELQINPENYF